MNIAKRRKVMTSTMFLSWCLRNACGQH